MAARVHTGARLDAIEGGGRMHHDASPRLSDEVSSPKSDSEEMQEE